MAKKALKIKDHDGTYPKFEDFSSFMSSISSNVNDPVYGSDNYYEKTKSSTGKPAPGKPTHSTHQAHANDDDKSQNHIGLGNKRIPCTLCKTMGHRLFQCKDFLTMNVD